MPAQVHKCDGAFIHLGFRHGQQVYAGSCCRLMQCITHLSCRSMPCMSAGPVAGHAHVCLLSIGLAGGSSCCMLTLMSDLCDFGPDDYIQE